MKTMEQIKSMLPAFKPTGRKASDVAVRQVFCFLSHKEGYSESEIGMFIGCSRSNVSHSVNKVK